MYDLIVFDLDGTLVDSLGDIADAMNEALAELGRPALDDAVILRHVGEGARRLVRGCLAEGGQPPSDALVADAQARYQAAYARHPVRRTTPYLGVREALGRLAKGRALAVATNKPGALARAVVDGVGLAGRFVAVLGADDVGRTKPDPLVLDLLRGTVGATRGATLFVGDSLVDAATAEAARVDLALVTYGYAEPAAIRACPARFHVDRLAELVPRLEGE